MKSVKPWLSLGNLSEADSGAYHFRLYRQQQSAAYFDQAFDVFVLSLQRIVQWAPQTPAPPPCRCNVTAGTKKKKPPSTPSTTPAAAAYSAYSPSSPRRTTTAATSGGDPSEPRCVSVAATTTTSTTACPARNEPQREHSWSPWAASAVVSMGTLLLFWTVQVGRALWERRGRLDESPPFVAVYSNEREEVSTT